MFDKDKLLHHLVVDLIKDKYTRDYSKIIVNEKGYPDLLFDNYGMTMMQIVVETESGVNEQNVVKWKSLCNTSGKLLLVIPKSCKLKATDLLWQHGLSEKVKLGFYELKIEM